MWLLHYITITLQLWNKGDYLNLSKCSQKWIIFLEIWRDNANKPNNIVWHWNFNYTNKAYWNYVLFILFNSNLLSIYPSIQPSSTTACRWFCSVHLHSSERLPHVEAHPSLCTPFLGLQHDSTDSCFVLNLPHQTLLAQTLQEVLPITVYTLHSLFFQVFPLFQEHCLYHRGRQIHPMHWTMTSRTLSSNRTQSTGVKVIDTKEQHR